MRKAVTNSMDNDFYETCQLRVLNALRHIIRAVDAHSRKLNDDFKITAPQLICLYTLIKEGPLTQSRLAKMISMGGSTTNGVIDRLEKKGLVVRQRDTRDRRKVFLTVTEAGKEVAGSAPPALQERFSLALRKLPELEQAAIALSLERVVELMEVDHLEAWARNQSEYSN